MVQRTRNLPFYQQKRVGRGEGSRHGRTAGRGNNGQKSRSGTGLKPMFEGGQTTIVKRFPKHGFFNLCVVCYTDDAPF